MVLEVAQHLGCGVDEHLEQFGIGCAPRSDPADVGQGVVAGVVEALVNPVLGRVSDTNGRLTPVRLGLAGAAVVAASWICPPLRTDSATDICRCSIGNYDTKSQEATITLFDEAGAVVAGPSTHTVPPNGNFSVVGTPGPTRCGCTVMHQGSKAKFAASLSTKSDGGDEKAVECR